MTGYQLRYRGKLLAGVDEVGRGPLAGDVVTAAVILDPRKPVAGLADSKKLSVNRRNQLAEEIREKALSWHVARASVDEIDKYNILRATLMAMVRAVDGLTLKPEYVAVDGNRLPDWEYAAEAVVGGDDKVPAISAASILAKVCRDAEMCLAEQAFPGYGFASHKGYGTRAHREAIVLLGPCLIHRKSFEPVKSLLSARQDVLT
ncbi:MAG: ribonuclease HII [Porticoccus sp.]|jgi:ribonuclease HII|uniref:ribonuclease HII n=1 Tax=Porticoccus hydrocarbonoclasticus TaxID=1073414 RepID=UPI00055E8D17|nr:ribonuclease HII [Porticoccus hydrocarbonoclasticus]MBG57717.1 ribonuclease HII [Porticoccus sp.]|tara:strand:- start:719 stop:1330 length:612 start_codon:yes stop_codon:yes gene_type:complete